MHNEPVLVVGAGPAGLATAAMLQRAGIAARILEAGPGVGTSWARYYDHLRLHTGRRISGLPGFPLPGDYPVFVSRAAFLQYLRAYARRFNLVVSPHQRVRRAARIPGGWRVETDDTVWEAPVLVAASGIGSHPYIPPLPGRETYRGTLLHALDYHRPEAFAGQDVLVVGMGNSATEIALDLAGQARRVTLAVRSGITVVSLRMYGLPTSYWGTVFSFLPRGAIRPLRLRMAARMAGRLQRLGLVPGAPEQFPVIGTAILDAVAAGRVHVAPGLAGFTADAVRFLDGSAARFDAVVLATGFRPALDYLAAYIQPPDEKQARLGLLAASNAPNLYLVGFFYDGLRGQLFNIGLQAREVARRIARSGAAHQPDAWVESAAHEMRS